MSRRLTFQGGIHVDENKHTRKVQIKRMPAPASVSLPMIQHIGAPCMPLVKVGDIVELGQKIGDVAPDKLGCPVHSPVSGKVTAIRDIYNTAGKKIQTVVIENDGEYRACSSIKPFEKRLADTSTEEIVSIIREAGVAGMGGAGFPSYAKINSALGKVTTLIINCAECEPYITANHRLLLEHPEMVINGAKILLKALGLRNALIAVEDNKLDAINKLEELLEDSRLIKVKILKTKYPQGDERQLIYALTGKELPSGKLPADMGCVIFNPETASVIYKAFAYGTPLIERIVTIDGDCVKEPANLLIPIGTPLRAAIEFCGGFKKDPYKVITGGPMMGSATWDLDSPIIKTTSAVLVMSEAAAKKDDRVSQCIRCGRCVGTCPMHLMPLYLAALSKAGDFEKCEEFNVKSCVECGSCAYNCPGNVPIVQHIRAAKAELLERKTRESAQKLKLAEDAKRREVIEAAARVKEESKRLAQEQNPGEAEKPEKPEKAEKAEIPQTGENSTTTENGVNTDNAKPDVETPAEAAAANEETTEKDANTNNSVNTDNETNPEGKEDGANG